MKTIHLAVFFLAGLCVYLASQVLVGLSTNAELSDRLTLSEARLSASEKLRAELALQCNTKLKKELDDAIAQRLDTIDDFDSPFADMPLPDVLLQTIRPSGNSPGASGAH